MNNKPRRPSRRTGKARDILSIAQVVAAVAAAAYEVIAPQVRKWRRKRKTK